ncbi:MAG: hypothetical protein DMF03_03720 [Verrucomicrobia bacterium]|nr:MAG: hypothetical protein DMF03_03720 [Verrucomicrobiota bacterium]
MQIHPQTDDGRDVKLSPPRALVISFQRSGLNWLRHCAEHFGGIRTPGRPQLIREGPVLFDRAHDVRRSTKRSDFAGLYAADGTEIYGKVALLLRNPYDCFTSHYLGRRGFRFKKGLEAFESYANNINAFDQLRWANKAVFYFEDYINQKAGTFGFLRFFGIEPADAPDNFEGLIESSRAWYRAHHGVITDEERPKLSIRERAAIREMLQRCLGQRYEKYLGSRIRNFGGG